MHDRPGTGLSKILELKPDNDGVVRLAPKAAQAQGPLFKKPTAKRPPIQMPTTTNSAPSSVATPQPEPTEQKAPENQQPIQPVSLQMKQLLILRLAERLRRANASLAAMHYFLNIINLDLTKELEPLEETLRELPHEMRTAFFFSKERSIVQKINDMAQKLEANRRAAEAAEIAEISRRAAEAVAEAFRRTAEAAVESKAAAAPEVNAEQELMDLSPDSPKSVEPVETLIVPQVSSNLILPVPRSVSDAVYYNEEPTLDLSAEPEPHPNEEPTLALPAELAPQPKATCTWPHGFFTKLQIPMTDSRGNYISDEEYYGALERETKAWVDDFLSKPRF